MKLVISAYAFLSLCTAFLSCGGKNAVEPLSGEIRFRDLPAIHAKRTESPSTETYLSLTIGYRCGDQLEREIQAKDDLLAAAAVPVGAGVVKEDLSDVERFEQLREKLRSAFNGALSRPAVVKVIIKDIKIR